MSTFGGFVSGMENRVKREGWDLISNAKLPDKQVDVIMIDKENCKYFDCWNLFTSVQKSDSTKNSIEEAYQGGGQCIRCNAKITNSQKNTSKQDEAFKFDNCECKLCFACATSMDNFIDYRCSHNHTLGDSEKKSIFMIHSLYNYTELFKLLFPEENNDLYKAREDFVNLYYDYLKSLGQPTSKKQIRKCIREFNLNTAEEMIRGRFSFINDIVNSAVVFSKNKKADAECGICTTNWNSVCLPQCGHPICLKCLKGIVNKQCPVCQFKFYRIVVLREKMNGESLEEFLKNNKKWIQEAINE